MAVTATPIFPQGLKTWGASIGNGDAQAWKRLLDMAGTGPGAQGSKIIGINLSSNDTSARDVQIALVKSGAVTVTNASPGVVTWANNNLSIGSQVFFTAATIPPGLTANTPYFVISAGFVAGSTFQVSATAGGAAINTTGTGTTVVCYSVRILTTIPVAITAGTVGTVGAAYVFNSSWFPGYSVDNDGNPYVLLAPTDYIAISAVVTVTSNKIIEAMAWGGDF